MKNYELVAAKISDPFLLRAYHRCGDRLGKSSKTVDFPETRCLLPPGKRPYYDSMIAFARQADDMLDDPNRAVPERARRFEEFRNRIASALDGDLTPPDDAEEGTDALIAAAFAHCARTWDISAESVHLFLRGLCTDLEVTGYPTYADLHEYMLAVSGQPALWINAVLEPSSDAAAEMAVSLSHAIYLLHFVRDFTEDLELGRVYLPEEDIGRSGVDRREIEELVEHGSVGHAMRPIVHRQANRINGLLAVSEGWWRLVRPSSRWFVRQTHRLAVDSLRRLVRRDYRLGKLSSFDSFRKRAVSLGSTSTAYLRALAQRSW
ncbi:phytoene synthase [Actinopolyspora xinjiangensis]|uniref:Phytoene synthase n=1 Tax=Actinopolyspora xinjiangensis TaxID=405564 RepID=A0A1H0X332_9ACTN|nr:squalene/phytoene synthase family protein [Actinopolyspora xinjiangensis]SDP97322.1 phytoene synthase [Actinopolyspora xinjiangensis]